MIIWGSKAKEKKVMDGAFFCPGCKSDAGYSHMRVSKYFTLYFIPLFPTSTLGDYVVCHTCRGELPYEVLSYSKDQILSMLQPWACGVCHNTNPSSEASCLGCGSAKPAGLPTGATPPPLPPSA